jgi:hypothetical protein
MRISILSKANESLPITSRLSDGTKYLFLNSIVDQMIITSLERFDPLIKNRIQSYEMIQLVRNQSENLYESVLDACTMIIRVTDNPEAIRSAVTVTSQVSNISVDSCLFYYEIFTIFFCSWQYFLGSWG